jgi:DNA repair exonuclease SbcCD nuclease subunit
MLISGDLFDSRFVSEETGELFCSLVEQSGIYVVLAPGNHDPYSENSFYAKAQTRLGERFVLFTSPELQIFDIDRLRTRVFGYAFTSAVLSESPLAWADIPEKNGYTHLLCAHADVFSPVSRYAPISVDEIRRCGFDYAALGHVHNKWSDSLDERIRYCGFGEGRSFDELGEGGVWIVDVNGDDFSCERKILSQRAFYTQSVQASAEDDSASLKTKICTEIKAQGYGEGAHLRLTLEGVADDTTVADVRAMGGEIADECSLEFIEIFDQTLPLLDGEYLERDVTLRGVLYKTLRPKLVSSDPDERRRAIKALRIGLAAIDGKSIFAAAEKGGQK